METSAPRSFSRMTLIRVSESRNSCRFILYPQGLCSSDFGPMARYRMRTSCSGCPANTITYRMILTLTGCHRPSHQQDLHTFPGQAHGSGNPHCRAFPRVAISAQTPVNPIATHDAVRMLFFGDIFWTRRAVDILDKKSMATRRISEVYTS